MDGESYQCPGEAYTITHSVHLGRLASFYSKCRECPHRNEVGGLGRRTVRALEARPTQRTLEYVDQGVRGVYLNEMTRATARDVVGRFGLFLRRQTACVPSRGRSGDADEKNPSPEPRAFWSKRPSKVVVARDEHPRSPDLAVGAIEGFRFAGCEVVDLGVASSPCLAFCIQHFGAAGGAMVCGDETDPSLLAIRLWRAGGKPLDAEAEMGTLREMVASVAQRPSRSASPYSTFQGSVPYLACLLKHFHALRPLKVAVACAGKVMEDYTAKLFDGLVCTRIPAEPVFPADRASGDNSGKERVARKVVQSKAHVGVFFESDGERATFFDEQGQPVGMESIFLLLVRSMLREQSPLSVVLGEGASGELRGTIQQLGVKVIATPAHPASLFKAMHASGARLGGETLGRRLWFQEEGITADTLLTLAGVLTALSWTDLPMSQVLESFGQAVSESSLPSRVAVAKRGVAPEFPIP